MHHEAYEFLRQHATTDVLTVIEIGSRNVNGTARDHFPNAIWTGLDLYEGPCVDVVCDAESWSPPSLVDLVVCCEVLEHARNWRDLIDAAERWLKPGGRFLMTCAGPGRIMHSHIDGLELRPGEYYTNLSEVDICLACLSAGLHHIRTTQCGNDTYAIARK